MTVKVKRLSTDDRIGAMNLHRKEIEHIGVLSQKYDSCGRGEVNQPYVPLL